MKNRRQYLWILCSIVVILSLGSILRSFRSIGRIRLSLLRRRSIEPTITKPLQIGHLPGCPANFSRPFVNSSVTIGRTPPEVYHLSGKFARLNYFKDAVLSHGAYVRGTGVIDSDKIFEYYEFPKFIRRNPVWKKQHIRFLTNPHHRSKRGGGYWFWKPTLIYHHLQQESIKNGDFLIYTDNDVAQHLQILPFLLEQMVFRGHNLALHEMKPDRMERVWTKRDVFEAYCVRFPYNM